MGVFLFWGRFKRRKSRRHFAEHHKRLQSCTSKTDRSGYIQVSWFFISVGWVFQSFQWGYFSGINLSFVISKSILLAGNLLNQSQWRRAWKISRPRYLASSALFSWRLSCLKVSGSLVSFYLIMICSQRFDIQIRALGCRLGVRHGEITHLDDATALSFLRWIVKFAQSKDGLGGVIWAFNFILFLQVYETKDNKQVIYFWTNSIVVGIPWRTIGRKSRRLDSDWEGSCAPFSHHAGQPEYWQSVSSLMLFCQGFMMCHLFFPP